MQSVADSMLRSSVGVSAWESECGWMLAVWKVPELLSEFRVAAGVFALGSFLCRYCRDLFWDSHTAEALQFPASLAAFMGDGLSA